MYKISVWTSGGPTDQCQTSFNAKSFFLQLERLHTQQTSFCLTFAETVTAAHVY